MGICRIQKPTGFQSTHGKLYAQIFCNGEEGEEFDFDATKGDLKINLVCEEAEDSCIFYIGKGDNDEMLNEIRQKLISIQAEQVQIRNDLDFIKFEKYMQDNPIEINIDDLQTELKNHVINNFTNIDLFDLSVFEKHIQDNPINIGV